MIARVAEHCVWLGRYLERSSATARALAGTHSLALDGELSPEQCWAPMVIVSGEQDRFAATHGADRSGDGEIVQRYLTWDRDCPVSVGSSLGAARFNARSIREVVSLEVWETINAAHLWFDSPEARALYEGRRFAYYREVQRWVQLTYGFLRSTMLRDTPFDFVQLGIMLERAGQTARFLDVHHHALTAGQPRHEIVETALWLSLLRSCSGYEPFMKLRRRASASSVVRFLVGERRFPRSVAYCTRGAFETLRRIRPPEQAARPGARAWERVHDLDDWITQVTSEPIEAGAVHGVLTRVVDDVHATLDLLAIEMFGAQPDDAVTAAS